MLAGNSEQQNLLYLIVCRFKDFCTGTGRSSLQCVATATAIGNSPGGVLGRRVGALCVSLSECPAQASACPPQQQATRGLTAFPKALDYCTVTGYDGDESLADLSLTGNSCINSTDCSQEGNVCSMAAPARVCSCDSNSGAVSCGMRGSCQPSPCKVCSDCVTRWASFVDSVPVGHSAAAVSAMFQAQCRSFAAGYSPEQCTATGTIVFASGNTGRRAGAICSILGACPSALVGDASCAINSLGKSGPLDLCTKEGVANGTTKLPGVITEPGERPHRLDASS